MDCMNLSEMLGVTAGATQSSWWVHVRKRPHCSRMLMWPKLWQHI